MDNKQAGQLRRRQRQKPYVLEMFSVGKWFEIERFVNEGEASARKTATEKSGAQSPLRVRYDPPS